MVRQAIANQFTGEVQYLSDSELEQRTDSNGRFSDGATMISVEMGVRAAPEKTASRAFAVLSAMTLWA